MHTFKEGIKLGDSELTFGKNLIVIKAQKTFILLLTVYTLYYYENRDLLRRSLFSWTQGL